MKRALIIGIYGQIGFYLSNILVQNGYEVKGTIATDWLRDYDNESSGCEELPFHLSIEMTKVRYSDPDSWDKLIRAFHPDEIYILTPVNIGTEHVKPLPSINYYLYVPMIIRLLSMIRELDGNYKPRLFHACQNDLFGMTNTVFQTELSPFAYIDPSVAVIEKAYILCCAYRKAYRLHVSNGILFDCFSPYLSESSFARYISKSLAEFVLGKKEVFITGDLSPKRDRMHACDGAWGMYLAMQQEDAGDYIFASGISARREILLYHAANSLGMTIRFVIYNGIQCGYLTGLDEDVFNKSIGTSYLARVKNKLVNTDLSHLNVLDREKAVIISNSFKNKGGEASTLLGKYSKAKKKLNWYPYYHFADVIKEMVFEDVNRMMKPISDFQSSPAKDINTSVS